MKRTSLPTSLKSILDRIVYATIATADSSGQPWNSPVVGKWDDNLNLYWVSAKKSQHSQNIALRPRILVVVYDSTVPEGEGLGIYLEMEAKLLRTNAEILKAKEVYDTGFFKHADADHQHFLAVCPQGFYKAVPLRVWYNDDSAERGHFIDTRAEFKLD
jgi:general stress protein 26